MSLSNFWAGDFFFGATNENKSNGLWLTFGDSSSFWGQLLTDQCKEQPAGVIPRHLTPTEISCQHLVCSEINDLTVHL